MKLDRPQGMTEQEWSEMPVNKQVWWTQRVAKRGSVEAVREAMSSAGRLSKGIAKRSGFALNKELASEAGKKGSATRWGK